MKVKDLIAWLETIPGDAEVWVTSDEGGYLQLEVSGLDYRPEIRYAGGYTDHNVLFIAPHAHGERG